jgi:diguanylate cyclase (GGDEF)-like protein/PAS domain S-box-containing protein
MFKDLRQLSKLSAQTVAFLVCTLLIIAALFGQLWWSITQDKSVALAAEQESSLLTVRILEEHANRIFQNSAHVLGALSEELRLETNRNEPDQKIIHQLLINQRQDSHFLKAISVFNTKGQLLASSSQFPVPKLDIARQPQIQFLLQHPDAKNVTIGQAVRFFNTGQWVLPVAKNIFDANGQMMIAEAEIDLTYLQDFYERTAKDADAAISLYDNQNKLLVRAPFDARYQQLDIQSTSLAQHLHAGQREGMVRAKSLISGGEESFYTYRLVTNFPLSVVVTRTTAKVLTDWLERSREKAFYAALTLLLVLCLVVLLRRQINQVSMSRSKLVDSENRYRMLFEDAQDPILLISRSHIYVDCNHAAVKLFGLHSREELIGKRVGSHSVDPDALRLLTQLHGDISIEKTIDEAFEGQVQRFDWVTKTNGALFYSDVTLSRVEIAGQELVFCIMRDVNARKYVEHVLEGQNQLLQLIGGSEDLNHILKETCRFVEETTLNWRCGIQLLSDDQRCFTQSIGINFPTVLQAQLIDMPVAFGSGVWSEAVIDAVPVWVDKIQQAESMQFVNQLEQLNQFSGCGAWPIMGRSGQLLGVFTLFVQDCLTLSNDELSLISITTDIASIAIEGKRSEEKVLRLAHYDELTGLPNRFLYNQHLAKSLAYGSRNHTRLAVLFLDLDRFKNINDTFGHDEGDRVLHQAAKRFLTCLRATDTIARVGGDEFILLIDCFSTPRDLGDIADKLLVAAALPFEIHGEECQLSASIGIATYPDDGSDAQTLMKNADIAMYRAKNKGKNNYQFYASEMNVHTVERLAFEGRLRRALERREFVVYYQPKVDVQSGYIVGAEALVRWNHPEKGLLLPGEFISIAEEAGLISRLGMLVLDIACRDILTFKEADPLFGRVAINLSGAQFNDANLLEDIQSVADFWRVDASSVELEITESMVMHNREQAIVLMDGLKKAGFTLSIDDFGTGYSSLAYLKRFPVDSVKIDRSFIKDIPDDPNDTAIVLAIVAMAHTLGLKVIAEGVETAVQLQTLADSKYDQYQGFYFSKAIPATEFMLMLKKQSYQPRQQIAL